MLNAVVGFAGLGVTVAALESGRRLALANKESLVAGAPVVQRGPGDAPGRSSSRSTPSTAPSTSASRAGRADAVARVVLTTASGGPFRGRTAAETSRR